MNDKQNHVTRIKCEFSNRVHKLIDGKFGIKNSEKWRVPTQELTDSQKVVLFNEILKLDKESTKLISGAYYKRREKRRTERVRMEKGYVPKRKTSLTMWLRYQESNVDMTFDEWFENQNIDSLVTVGDLELVD